MGKTQRCNNLWFSPHVSSSKFVTKTQSAIGTGKFYNSPAPTPVCPLETRPIKEQTNKLFINQGKGRLGCVRKKENLDNIYCMTLSHTLKIHCTAESVTYLTNTLHCI